jgi:PKD repeat protein
MIEMPATKRTAPFIVIAIVVLLFGLPQAMPDPAHATSIAVSTIAISPVDACCYQVDEYFNVNVTLNLAAGESVNAFDVIINYTNPYSVLQGVSIDNSIGLFNPLSPQVLIACIDGVTQGSSQCGPGDTKGQIDFSEGVLGTGISGPVQGLLFSMEFEVVGVGVSTFVVDTANLADPNPDASDPAASGYAHYIPVLTDDGIYANEGVVAFFNYQPADTSVSPSILPNEEVVFDATGSFVPGNSSDLIRMYSWNFGDGTPSQVNQTAVVEHRFNRPGNYTVLLTVSDERNVTGVLIRLVIVSPMLGSISLTVRNQVADVLNTNVLIKVFNTSSSPSPAVNQTISILGITQINRLTPGNYFVLVTGQGYYSANRTEQVLPGWTTMDTVYLSSVPGPTNPPDYSGIIYVGSIAAAIGVIGTIIALQRRNTSTKKAGKSSRSKGAR